VITLVIGGASSGKSALAESYVATLAPPVTYVATWVAPPGAPDAEMVERVAAHRRRRPASWGLVEVGLDLGAALRPLAGTVLVDALGTWVAGAAGLAVDVVSLCDVLGAREGDTVLVSDEVGLGVHPSSDAGRRFREVLGRVNEAVAAIADDVWLVVAGRVLSLVPPPWAPSPPQGPAAARTGPGAPIVTPGVPTRGRSA